MTASRLRGTKNFKARYFPGLLWPMILSQSSLDLVGCELGAKLAGLATIDWRTDTKDREFNPQVSVEKSNSLILRWPWRAMKERNSFPGCPWSLSNHADATSTVPLTKSLPSALSDIDLASSYKAKKNVNIFAKKSNSLNEYFKRNRYISRLDVGNRREKFRHFTVQLGCPFLSSVQ